MNIVEPEVEKYLLDNIPEPDPILIEMERMGRERSFPIIGPLVGRLCYQLVKTVGAKRIFELGSGFGYSAMWMAQALPDDGQIFCTEKSGENIELARGFFRRGGVLHKVEFLKGNALELIKQVSGQFDLMLNDIDKESYPTALDLMIPRIRKGGYLITDNMIWHGRVTQPDPDRATQGILKYTKRLFASRDLFTSIIPLRDGVAISLKL